MRAAVAIAAFCLLTPGCSRYARVEYEYSSQHLDSVSGIRLRPRDGVALDLGSGARYDAASGDVGTLLQAGASLGTEKARLRVRVDVTVPEVIISGMAGLEVEF